MNYTEIVNTALSYSDREDAEVQNRIDDFLRIVEARVNRFLRTLEMQVRASIVTTVNKEYYALPEDFNGLVDIEIRDSESSRSRRTLQYISPEAMNVLADPLRTSSTGKIYYTIIANQIQIMAPQDGQILEVVYFRRITPITSTETTNWLSDEHPDCYVFGLLTEINSFVKDKDATALWESRFKESLSDIDYNNAKKRWSGPSLQIQPG